MYPPDDHDACYPFVRARDPPDQISARFGRTFERRALFFASRARRNMSESDFFPSFSARTNGARPFFA